MPPADNGRQHFNGIKMQNTSKIERVRIVACILVLCLNKTGHVGIECFQLLSNGETDKYLLIVN
jgi:hypothetical protein